MGLAAMRPGDAGDGKLVFPRVPRAAGIYRLMLHDAGSPAGVYGSEADLLARRAQHNRTPGAGQQTNLRLTPIMAAALAAGGRIAVENAASAQLIPADGSAARLD